MDGRLRRLREDAGLYAREVAEAAGMSLRSYQDWETNGVPPQVRRAVLVAHSLGCTVEEMAGEVQEGSGSNE